jgi:uncharacterized protein
VTDVGQIAARYGPWAVVAGGSEGVGASVARRLAAEGINLVLVARKIGPLEQVAAEIRVEHGVEVRTLSLDLAQEGATDSVIDATAGLEVGLLFYNAGADWDGEYFLDVPVSRAEEVIRLNVLGQTVLSHHFAAGMRERRRGGIVLVGSLSGHVGHAGSVTYAAAKGYAERFAEGLWYELKPYDVDVVCFVLSFTITPALVRRGLATDSPDFPPAQPDDVAREAIDHIADGPLFIANGRAEFADYLNSAPRPEVIALMSEAVQAMFAAAGPRD